MTLLAGCATTNESTSPTPTGGATNQILNFTATQSPGEPNQNTTYSFTGPNTARPGWAEVNLDNQGVEPHQIIFVKLPSNMTFAEYQAGMTMMMTEDPNATEEFSLMPFTLIGGVAAALPSQTATTWVHLTPGVYAIECGIPGPAGPHSLHGMMAEFTVSDGPEVGAEPTPSGTLELANFSFNWSAEPTVGNNVIRVTNTADMIHEALFVKLVGNATMDEFLNWTETFSDPAPISMGFGAGAASPGQVQYVQADFTTGKYGEICFMPDEDGTPHFIRGMIGEFEVG